MALRGLRPIVEIMFGDFLTLGTDQIVNHLTKYSAMYAGAVRVPVVIRAPSGGGRGYGPTHSQSLEKLFLGVPHLKVVAPSRFHDPGSLLKAAAAEDMPVLFVEHKLLYSMDLLRTDADLLPLRVDTLGEGAFPTLGVRNYDSGRPDLVVISYGGLSRHVDKVLTDLADDEISALVVLPSLINDLDLAMLARLAASATAGCIVWEEGTQGFDWGAEVVAGLLQHAPSTLPTIRRLAAEPTIIPAARRLEEHVLPGADQLGQAALELVAAALDVGHD
jgi:pyruvate/2-oxoglutarate/acetoin dehydrogenase E1 component